MLHELFAVSKRWCAGCFPNTSRTALIAIPVLTAGSPTLDLSKLVAVARL